MIANGAEIARLLKTDDWYAVQCAYHTAKNLTALDTIHQQHMLKVQSGELPAIAVSPLLSEYDQAKERIWQRFGTGYSSR